MVKMKTIKAKSVLFPSIVFAIGFLIFFTRVISSPKKAWALSSSNDQSSPIQVKSQSQKKAVSPNFPTAILKWKNFIEKEALSLDLDPNLIAAVILQESGGDPQAYSSSGAVGLMQVMPRDGTAASFFCDGIPCFQSRPSMQDLFDAQFNITYGSGMLKNLFRRFGNWRDALQSYGPYDMGYRYADMVLALCDKYSNTRKEVEAG